MGVRGLTTYINCNHNSFLHDYLLHDTNLIVDGHSLCCQLYRLMNSFSAFGGDYDKFSLFTKNFFKSLKKCNVTCYVIFDGSYESRKLKTAYSRLRSKIYGASKLDPVTQSTIQIFPLLLRDVFKEVLSEMKISFTICEYEADDEIAAMARHLNCPVLSYDSDFFIYNVLYIPFNTVETKPKLADVNGTKLYVVECKLYQVENLINHFGGLKEDMLPLLATLLGNDYIEKKVFNNFFSHLKLPKNKTKKNDQQRSIHALFKWLQSETYDSAVAKILGRLKKNEKNKVSKIITKSVQGYDNRSCRSLKYFEVYNGLNESESLINKTLVYDSQIASEELYDSECSSEDEEKLSDKSENKDNISDKDVTVNMVTKFSPMSEWFVEGVRQKYIPQTYINLYTHNLHFCSPQAEDYNNDDSFLCTLPILRYAFDLLTDFSREKCIYVSRQRECNYQKMTLDNNYAIPRLLEKPYQVLSDDEKKSCFHHFITQKLPDLDLAEISKLPLNFQLYMISLLWWVKTCSVPISYIYSLFMCYIMLEVIDEKTGSYRSSYYFNKKYSQKLEELKKRPVENVEDNELLLNRNKVSYEDCLIAASALLNYFEIDESIRKRPKSYDVKRVHLFAQFQCCLQQFNSLNTICCKPFESTVYSKYNGTFVYNVALKLDDHNENPINFIVQHLNGACTVLKFFKSLCDIFEKCTEKMALKTLSWEKKKRRCSRRKRKTRIDEDIYFIIKDFESEVII